MIRRNRTYMDIATIAIIVGGIPVGLMVLGGIIALCVGLYRKATNENNNVNDNNTNNKHNPEINSSENINSSINNDKKIKISNSKGDIISLNNSGDKKSINPSG